MPESPEVKRNVDQIRPQRETYVGRVTFPGGRYATKTPDGFDDFNRRLGEDPLRFLDAQTKGKFSWWEFEDEWYMWCTYGMSGMWQRRRTLHTAVEFQLYLPKVENPVPFVTGHYDSCSLYFNDSRRFGTVKFVRGTKKLTEKLQTLGFDFIDKPQSTTAIWRYIHDARPKLLARPIGEVMLDQSVFCGVGNYLRAEILYVCGVSPWRPVGDITYDELARICEVTHRIMRESYESGGASLHTYVDADGNRGNFSSKFMAYNRKEDPYGHKVIREKTPEGRTIHWVREVQK